MATTPKITTTLTLSDRDVINLAFAVSNSARQAYIDNRLTTAATEHELAARIWLAAGVPSNASRHDQLSLAITREALEAVLQAEEEF